MLRADVEARAAARGLSAEDIAGCFSIDYGGGWWEVDIRHPSYPKRIRPGLGDLTQSGLAAVGITEERVSRAIGRPCGCGERAEKLNQIGRAFGIGSG
jgi:hypothetical protein